MFNELTENNTLQEPSGEVKEVKRKKQKRKKLPKAKGHPKFPKNGYVRYCDETRLQICEQNPTMDPVEVTKAVAAKWHALSVEEKQPYNDSFKADQERFKIEMREFEKKQEAFGNESIEKIPKKKKESKRNVNGETSSTLPETPAKIDMTVKKKEHDVPKAFISSNCELPIFTDTFLDHNKQIELELKLLRKTNLEIEQQNDVLILHIENMHNGVKKVESETISVKQQNAQLEKHLTKLKCILASGLNSVQLSLSGLKTEKQQTGASVENIAEYMTELTAEATSQKSPVAVNKAREILRKIDITC